MPHKLKLDKDGNIIASRVLGYTIGPTGGISVILAIQHAANPQEQKTGGQTFQALLTPGQALEIAQTLKSHAERILLSTSPGKPQ